MPFSLSGSSFVCVALFFRRLNAFDDDFSLLAVAFLGETIDIGFRNILHHFLKPSTLNNLVLDVRHNEIDMLRGRVRTP